MNFNILDGIRSEQQRVAQAEQNSSRYAWVRIFATSVGAGEQIVGPIAFPSPMLQRPFVSSGCEITRIPDREHWQIPSVTAGVYRWDRDDNGHYVGAWVFIRVVSEPTDLYVDELTTEEQEASPPAWSIRHDLVFHGDAYKKLPDDAVLQLEVLNLS